MNSWKIILAAVVIFGAGVTTGLVVHQVEVENAPPKESRRPAADPGQRPPAEGGRESFRGSDSFRPPQPEMLRKQFVQQLNNALKLTPEQREAIQKTISEGQEKNRQLWTNVAPQMKQVMQAVRQSIRAQLTPEQLKQFEELTKPRPPRKTSATNAPPGLLSVPTNAPPGA